MEIIRTSITVEKNLKILSKWFKLVARVDSMEALPEKM